MNIIIALIVLTIFSLKTFVSILNYKNRHEKLSKSVQDIYDKKAYQKWHQYFMEKFKSNLISKIFNTSILILFLLTNSFITLEKIIGELTTNNTLETLLFIGVLMLGSTIIKIPFSYYDTFAIEEKYGFNKTNHKTFFLDIIKKIVLTAGIGGGILVAVVKLINLYGNNFVYFVFSLWGFSVVIMLLASILITKVFIKIFYKLTPLEEGSLKDKISTISGKIGFDVKSICVMNASKRSTKSNAFFTGFGKMKDIVLYDTLIDKLSEDEIVSVLVHEIGHSVHKDTLKSTIRNILSMGLFILLLGLVLFQGGFSIGYALVIYFVTIDSLVAVVLGVVLNKLSRVAEFKADAFAAKHTSKRDMINALKVLSRENFINLSPHPLFVKIHFSHPPIDQRIQNINNN